MEVQLLIDDSKMLREMDDIVPTIEWLDSLKLGFDFNLLSKLYKENYKISNEELVSLVKPLDFLCCSKLMEILIIIKHKKIVVKFNRNIDRTIKEIKLDTSLFNTFISYGLIEPLRFLLKKEGKTIQQFNKACINGHLEVAKLLRISHCHNLDFVNIFKINNFNICKWIIDEKILIITDKKYFLKLCENGVLDVIKYVLPTITEALLFEGIKHSYIFLQLDVCKYFHQLNYDIPVNYLYDNKLFFNSRITDDNYNIKIEKYFNMIVWLTSLEIFTNEHINLIFSDFCKKNCKEVYLWIYDNYQINNNSLINIFEDICIIGIYNFTYLDGTDSLDWLYLKINSYISNDMYLLDMVFSNDRINMDLLKWICNICKEKGINVNENILKLFELICDKIQLTYNIINDSYEILEWLYENFIISNEVISRCFIEYGDLKLKKWLYSIGNIDIHQDNDKLFRKHYSSRMNSFGHENGYGHNIAKWLLTLDHFDTNYLPEVKIDINGYY